MIQAFKKRLIQLNHQRLGLIVLFLAVAIYIIQGIYAAHHMQPMMDEGTYLLKGLFFLKGKYIPYQTYGFVMNKPLFSFYSLGLSQLLEPGLRFGRYFSILIGTGVLLGLWLTIKRLFNIQWASFIVFFSAISSAIILYSTRAMTQVVTSLFIIWILYFILGKDRKDWQLYIGGVLAALLPITRQNLLPLYLLILLYLIWEHGRKGWYTVIQSLVISSIFIIVFWPGLFSTYVTTFLPDQISNRVLGFFKIEFLQDAASVVDTAMPDLGIFSKAMIFFQGYRNFLVPITASLLLLLSLPYKKILTTKNGKVVVFLLISYLSMVALHYLAVVINDVFFNNFPTYLAFFWPIGMVIIPYTFTLPDRTIDRNKVLLIAFILIFFVSIGFSLFEITSDYLLHLEVPRIRQMRFLPGTTDITSILGNKFDLPYYNDQRYLIGAISGFIAGLFFLLLSLVLGSIIKRKFKIGISWTIMTSVLLFSLVISPTRYFSGDSTIFICTEGDILAAQEEVADQVNSVIPPKSLVYLESITPISLLYIPDVRIFPPQANSMFYFIKGGVDEELLKYGYWNESLAQKWRVQADYLILGDERGRSIEETVVKTAPEKYSFMLETSSTVPCKIGTNLRIYRVNK